MQNVKNTCPRMKSLRKMSENIHFYIQEITGFETGK